MNTGGNCGYSFVTETKMTKTKRSRRSGVLLEKLATMMLMDIEYLLPEDTNLATLNMDARDTQPDQEPPSGGSRMENPARRPPLQRSPPILYRKFITTNTINEAAVTTPEGIAHLITAML